MSYGTITKQAIAAVAMAGFSLTAWAFTPAAGLWSIDSENNGQPGRGFQVEVENDTMVLSYYGYRADGSSVFYLASGAYANNQFNAQLMEYQGGVPIGSNTPKNATTKGSPGTINIAFTSGTQGTVTFPGETPKAVTKFSFGYPATPQGLFGTYLFSFALSTNSVNSKIHTLNKLLGQSTTDGNGIVTDPAATIRCENMTKGTFKNTIICVQYTTANAYNAYHFKMSGDQGAGIAIPPNSQYYYAAFISRLETNSGRRTGINDNKEADLIFKSNLAINQPENTEIRTHELSQEQTALQAPLAEFNIQEILKMADELHLKTQSTN